MEPMKERPSDCYNWYLKFGSGNEILVTGDLDYIVTQYPYAREVRPASDADVVRMERKASESKRKTEAIKKARR